MKLDMKLPPIAKTILAKTKVIVKHHYFIVAVLLFSGLGLGVYMVNDTLNLPTDTNYSTAQLQSTIGTKFNKSAKDTIEKIKALQKTSDPNNSQSPFPAGRINPFAE